MKKIMFKKGSNQYKKRVKTNKSSNRTLATIALGVIFGIYSGMQLVQPVKADFKIVSPLPADKVAGQSAEMNPTVNPRYEAFMKNQQEINKTILEWQRRQEQIERLKELQEESK